MQVTRRTAIAAGVAALFAPTVRLQVERSDIERLLSVFVDRDDYGIIYDHSKPYHLGGWTYCTDARHMAWAELCRPDEDGGERRIPKVEEVRRNLFRPRRWVDLSLPAIESLEVRDHAVCPRCGNRRVSCGEHYPSPDWIDSKGIKLDYDVDDNTMRDASCDFCRGGQRKNIPSVATVCGLPFSYWRLLPIAAIPGVRVSATDSLTFPDNKTSGRVLCFESDGIQGVAMGLVL